MYPKNIRYNAGMEYGEVYEAIKGMLPKNSLGKKMFGKLKVYKGSEHPHQAQQPVELKIRGGRN